MFCREFYSRRDYAFFVLFFGGKKCARANFYTFRMSVTLVTRVWAESVDDFSNAGCGRARGNHWPHPWAELGGGARRGGHYQSHQSIGLEYWKGQYFSFISTSWTGHYNLLYNITLQETALAGRQREEHLQQLRTLQTVWNIRLYLQQRQSENDSYWITHIPPVKPLSSLKTNQMYQASFWSWILAIDDARYLVLVTLSSPLN